MGANFSQVKGANDDINVKRLPKKAAPQRFGRKLTASQRELASHICIVSALSSPQLESVYLYLPIMAKSCLACGSIHSHTLTTMAYIVHIHIRMNSSYCIHGGLVSACECLFVQTRVWSSMWSNHSRLETVTG